jgi:broad specificity phosphatase PhoE
MPRRITLVRHGRSALEARGWLDLESLNRWFDEYDAAGIRDDDHPPAALCEQAREAGIVVASDLPRARASAERLLPGGSIELSPLLREIPMPIPPIRSVRLPFSAWALITFTRWSYRNARGVKLPPESVERIAAAVEWLAGLTAEHESVLAVTHANFRTYLAPVLLEAGWKRIPGGKRYANWSAWMFEEVRRT